MLELLVAAEAIGETFGGCAQRIREQISRAAQLALDAGVQRIHTPEEGSGHNLRAMLDDRSVVRDLRNQLDVIAVLDMVEVRTSSF